MKIIKENTKYGDVIYYVRIEDKTHTIKFDIARINKCGLNKYDYDLYFLGNKIENYEVKRDGAARISKEIKDINKIIEYIKSFGYMDDQIN